MHSRTAIIVWSHRLASPSVGIPISLGQPDKVLLRLAESGESAYFERSGWSIHLNDGISHLCPYIPSMSSGTGEEVSNKTYFD
jgi:hypothetical protein